MKGYRTRFEQGRGHQMVLVGEPPVQSDELDRLQYRMLSRQEGVPGLLPVQAEEIDGSVSLRYTLTGYRMLAQSFRVERWTMEEALEALGQMADTLEQANEYMLDLERFSLEDEFIFVGSGWGELALTYVPVARKAGTMDFGAQLERLIVRWMMNVERPDGPTLQKLLRQAGSMDFSPSKLRRLVRHLLANSGEKEQEVDSGLHLAAGHGRPASLAAASHRSHPTPGNEAASSVASLNLRQAPAFYRNREAGNGQSAGGRFSQEDPSAGTERSVYPEFPADERSFKTENQTVIPPIEPQAKPQQSFQDRGYAGEPQSLSGLLGREPGEWDPSEEEGKEKASPGRWRTWLLSGAGAATAIAWRFIYLPHPGRREFILSIGVTLLALGACVFLWNGWKNRRPKRTAGITSSNSGSGGPWEADEEGWSTSDREPSSGNGRFGLPIAAAQAGSIPSRGPAPLAFSNGREEAEGRATAWLHADEGTMLLAEPESLLDRGTDCYLEWEQDGGRQRIRLTGKSLVIGRSSEAAQHVDETPGVSRAHLELLQEEESWRAKDLGSRNGSWLNGVPMAPYEAYPLTKGDSLQIASSLYRFQEGAKLDRL